MAIARCRQLETHARRIYDLDKGKKEKVESAEALLSHLREGRFSNGFSPTEVYSGKHWAKLKDASQVHLAIGILEKHHWVKTQLFRGEGRPGKRVYINLRLDEFYDKFYNAD